MAFGTGSELLFIEGQDFLIVWRATVATENRVGFSWTAAVLLLPQVLDVNRCDLPTDAGLLVGVMQYSYLQY